MALDTLKLDDLSKKWTATRQTVNGDGEVTSEIRVPERMAFEFTDGMVADRVSTLVDAEGNVIQQWIKEGKEREALSLLREQLDEMTKTLPRVDVIPLSTGDAREDWLTLIPVGDHHFGMLSWKYETGESYDVDIAESLLASATDYLLSTTPKTRRGVLTFMGDYLHYDSMVAMTPQHGNILDSDGRKAKIVRAANRAMRRMIEKAAEKFELVHVIIEFGNHDPDATLWLMEAMRCIYENNPRITIDTNPGAFHYYQFGRNGIMTHHGDKVKMADLPGVFAARQPKIWGDTAHRLILTGHIHHTQVHDYPGCTVESMRVLPPNDAYGHLTGHEPRRGMQALVLHHDNGELARTTFHPGMLNV